ncbi:LysR family transcriptional regulator [Oleidesulfovibrio sp.]|uniref:LysR family transcriptional regulator n=1 Tax=Oleidesulfovibrio sp. TaxID=2909707 RepID=UPI003A85F2EC
MLFSLEQLEAFQAAAETGSFSAAARKLGKAQSAVSTAVSNLEIDLGVELFDRSGHKAMLTPAGETMLREAWMVLGECERFKERAVAIAGGQEAKLSLAVDDALPIDWFVDVLATFGERFPLVQLETYYGAMGDVARMVGDGQADLGIVMPVSGTPAAIDAVLIGHMAYEPIAAASHPLAGLKKVGRRDLMRYRHIVVASRIGDREPDWAGHGGPVWLQESTYATLQLVLRQAGWASLPRHLVERHVAEGRLTVLPLDFHSVKFMAPVFIVRKPGAAQGVAGLWLRKALEQLTLDD